MFTNQIKNKYDKFYIVPLDKLTKQELLELCESLQQKRLVQWLKVKSSTYSMVKTITIDELLVKFKSLEKIDHNSED
ncbi:hypothetical protein JMUB7498_26710 [Staphylococcus aureus]